MLRRVPEANVLDDRSAVKDAAFSPHRDRDVDGFSVYLESIHTIKEVAQVFRGAKGKDAWVVRLRVSDLMRLDLTLKLDPIPASDGFPDRPGHALIVDLRSETADDSRTQEIKRELARLAGKPIGPFPALNS